MKNYKKVMSQKQITLNNGIDLSHLRHPNKTIPLPLTLGTFYYKKQKFDNIKIHLFLHKSNHTIYFCEKQYL